MVFVVSPGTAERAADAGGRNRGRATSRRWVMSFRARVFGIEAGTVSLGCRHPAGCRRLPHPWKEVSESGPSWTAVKPVAAQRIRRDRRGGRRDREPAGRDPHQRQKPARHLQVESSDPARRPRWRARLSARVAPGADTSTCCETAVEPNRFGVAYRAMRLTTDRWAGPVYSVRLKRRCPSVG